MNNMNIEEIKNKALEMAKIYAEDKNFDFEKENHSAKDWYLIMRLAQVYYNCIKGIYDREQATKEQAKIINYVMDNKEIFEVLV